jgi:hypothetical protein
MMFQSVEIYRDFNLARHSLESRNLTIVNTSTVHVSRHIRV